MTRTVAREINRLPHWARVAYAARCARSVLPLFDRAWPHAATERKQYLYNAIQFTEKSSTEGQSLSGIGREVIIDALTTAGGAIVPMYEIPSDEPGPDSETNCLIAHYVAKAAERAAWSAQEEVSQSESWALSAYTFARDAAALSESVDILKQQMSDFSGILRVAKRGRWTDSTAVPAEVFDLLTTKDRAHRSWRFW